jgi:acetyltransferase
MTPTNYPDHYRQRTITKSGLRIVIRALGTADGPRLEKLFYSLSPKTVYFRFFSRLKTLSPEMLHRLVDVDHERDIALVASRGKGGGEAILGVFRLMCGPDRKQAEFSIVVGDPWQGQGVGARLFQYGLAIARARGIQFVWGLALSENRVMLALAKKMGFTTHWNDDAGAYEMDLNLKGS